MIIRPVYFLDSKEPASVASLRNIWEGVGGGIDSMMGSRHLTECKVIIHFGQLERGLSNSNQKVGGDIDSEVGLCTLQNEKFIIHFKQSAVKLFKGHDGGVDPEASLLLCSPQNNNFW